MASSIGTGPASRNRRAARRRMASGPAADASSEAATAVHRSLRRGRRVTPVRSVSTTSSSRRAVDHERASRPRRARRGGATIRPSHLAAERRRRGAAAAAAAGEGEHRDEPTRAARRRAVDDEGMTPIADASSRIVLPSAVLPGAVRCPAVPTYHPRMRLVDSHGHLQAQAFADDAARVLAAARAAGLERLLAPGWDAATSLAGIDLRASLDVLTVGGLPSARGGRRDTGRSGAHRGARARPARARHRRDGPRLRPRLLTAGRPARQPALAHRAGDRRGKPLILHCRSAPGRRDAQDDLVRELRDAGVGSAAWRSGSMVARPRCSTRSRVPWTTRRRPRARLRGEHLGPRVPGGGGGHGGRGAAGARRASAGRDRLAVPVATGCPAPQRATLGGGHGPLGGGAAGRGSRRSWATSWWTPSTGRSVRPPDSALHVTRARTSSWPSGVDATRERCGAVWSRTSGRPRPPPGGGQGGGTPPRSGRVAGGPSRAPLSVASASSITSR